MITETFTIRYEGDVTATGRIVMQHVGWTRETEDNEARDLLIGAFRSNAPVINFECKGLLHMPFKVTAHTAEASVTPADSRTAGIVDINLSGPRQWRASEKTAAIVKSIREEYPMFFGREMPAHEVSSLHQLLGYEAPVAAGSPTVAHPYPHCPECSMERGKGHDPSCSRHNLRNKMKGSAARRRKRAGIVAAVASGTVNAPLPSSFEKALREAQEAAAEIGAGVLEKRDWGSEVVRVEERGEPPMVVDMEHPLREQVIIYLNGRQAEFCVAADVLGMWVRVQAIAADGVTFMRDDDDCPLYEKRVGKVEIRWADDDQAGKKILWSPRPGVKPY